MTSSRYMQKLAEGRMTSFKKKGGGGETGLWEDDFTLMSSSHRTTQPTFTIFLQTDPFLQIRWQSDPFFQISLQWYIRNCTSEIVV